MTLTLAFAAQSQAGPKSGSGKPSSGKTAKSIAPAKTTTAKNEPAKFDGVKFDNGYFYKGKNHDHWGPIRWDLRYGCYCFWDPCVASWYYWCEQDNCYYPVSFCPYRTYCNVGIAEVAEPAPTPVARGYHPNDDPTRRAPEPGAAAQRHPADPGTSGVTLERLSIALHLSPTRQRGKHVPPSSARLI